MRVLGRVVVAIALLGGTLVGAGTHDAGRAVAATLVTPKPLVVAQYYPWWEGNVGDRQEWRTSSFGAPFSLMPAAGWYYNQGGSPAIRTVQRQIREAQAYGVGGFAWEYSGYTPTSPTAC
jgi:hypothetical protein